MKKTSGHEININALYVGERWDVVSEEFKTDASLSNVCARGIGSAHGADGMFPSLETENAHFMFLIGDMDGGASLAAMLSFAQGFKSLNPEGVLLAVLPKSRSDDSCRNRLEAYVDHIVFVENGDRLSEPLKMINNALNASFMDLDFFDLQASFQKFPSSVLSTAVCKRREDLNAFVASVKKEREALRASADGLLVYLSVDGKRGGPDWVERVASAFEPIAEGSGSEVRIAAQLTEQDCPLKATVLTMVNA